MTKSFFISVTKLIFRPRLLGEAVMTKQILGESPHVVKHLQDVIGKTGGRVELKCEILGRPVPDITWIRFVQLPKNVIIVNMNCSMFSHSDMVKSWQVVGNIK